MKKILIGCEESQAVTIEFRKLGFEAYSCDILDQSGGYPEWHIKDSIFNVINDNWDLLIAFPPCTDLAVSGARHFERKRLNGSQDKSINFFMDIINAPIDKIAVENPVGIMSKIYKKPDQIIQPYYFGDPFQKTTCLWLKNLPLLYHNKDVNLFDKVITHTDKGEFFEWIDKKTNKKKRQPMWFYNALNNKNTGHIRSKTFNGIAKAMANQWGNFLNNNI